MTFELLLFVLVLVLVPPLLVPTLVALNVDVPLAIALSSADSVPEPVVLVFVPPTPDAVDVADFPVPVEEALVETAQVVPAHPYMHDWYTCVVHELVW